MIDWDFSPSMNLCRVEEGLSSWLYLGFSKVDEDGDDGPSMRGEFLVLDSTYSDKKGVIVLDLDGSWDLIRGFMDSISERG